MEEKTGVPAPPSAGARPQREESRHSGFPGCRSGRVTSGRLFLLPGPQFPRLGIGQGPFPLWLPVFFS